MVRENDLLILEKLDNLKEDTTDLRTQVGQINTTIHGNGSDGLKTGQGKLKTQVRALIVVVTVACGAILNDYIRRG